jgi:predicted ATPase/DNA-binding SARP family transcriptional activator
MRLFGLPRLELDGQVIATDRRKALALLIYLSVNGLDYTRETLATLLWPDQDTSHVLAYLRRTLWEINQTFGTGWAHTERDIVGLHPGAREQMWLDVSRFRTLVSQSRERNSQRDVLPLLEEAVGLYQDDFLAGFNLKDASLYEDWVSNQAEALRGDFLLSLENLARGYAKRGEMEKALDAAGNWVSRDTLNETAHSLLMEIYAQNGQPSAVARQYQECARILERELGLEPSSETKNLFEKLKKEAGRTPQRNAGALENASTRGNALPTPYATSFFGRRAELAELEKFLRDPTIRLVTILGQGGAGKTRLALEAGRIHAPLFEQGVYFVPLAPVGQPEYVVSAIANALGLAFVASESKSQAAQLADFLREKNLLLILDNLEHLLALPNQIGALVESLLEAAPRLRILATSHERLNLQQEWVLNVSGMPVPAAEARDWEQYGAVQLFVQNARKASAVLRLNEPERQAITRICGLVGGLPLGLELAAAWTKMLSCEEIAGEIELSLDFLKTRLKNVVERHQSLRATFEYSWNFLGEAEQLAFMRLAVFRGGFRREAALAVAEAPLPLLAGLADKSLLRRDESGRFDIHQALKPFALEKLAHNPGTQAQAAERHGRFFATLMRQEERHLRGRGQREALDEITTELDNVLQGWQWAIQFGQESDAQAYLEATLRYFDMRNRFHDAENLFGGAAQTWNERFGTENVTYALLLACHGWFCNRLSRIPQAHQLLLQSLEILRRLGEAARTQLMLVNSMALYVVPMMNDMAEVERIAQESLAFYQAQNDRWGMAQVLPFFHRMKTPQGLQDAIRLHNETLQIQRESGDSAGLAATLTSLGELLHYRGDYENARRCHQSSLELARELNDRRVIAASLDYLGFINRQMGEFELACRQHGESMEISRELGNALGIAGSLDNLGLIALDQRDYPEALSLFRQALPLRREAGQLGSVAISLEHIASAALHLDDLSLAETALQEALAILFHEPEWALTSHALNRLGDLELARGNFAAAQTHYRASLDRARDHESISVILDTLLCFSALAAAQGDSPRAVELAAYVEGHPGSEFAIKETARETIQGFEKTLPEKTFVDAVTAGKSLSFSDLATFASGCS